MNDLASVDKVRKLEDCILGAPQVDLMASMLAHGGMGVRTIFIPAGTVLTGALTKIANICVLHGDIEVTTDEGMKRLTGFHVITAEAGYKRAGLAHQDTWWTTVWRTDLTDFAAMEDEMTDESHLLQTRRQGIVFEHLAELE